MSYQSTQAPLPLGFIGGALDSAVGYAHFAACKMDKQFSLVAGCLSVDAAMNRDSAEVYGLDPERMYDSWQEMIEAEAGKLAAVVVLTPTPSHHEIVTACINAGFPVISEKALATNSADAAAIVNTCERASGFLAVTYNYSGYPMVREFRHLIEQDVLGDILHFQVEMPQEGFIRVDAQGNKPVPQAWRLADGSIPTIHLDLATHLHHLVYYLTREKAVEVIANQQSYGWFSDIRDNVDCMCEYTNGLRGHAWFSKSALGYRNGLRLRIFGSEAAVEWMQMNPEELTISFKDGRRQILDRADADMEISPMPRYNRFKAGHPAGFVEAFANLYVDIADCLNQYRENGAWESEEVFSGSLALEGLQMFEAMVRSTISRKWEAIQPQ